jgi:elongation factor Tu
MKTHVNVGTIGHVDHGKTTLTAAILAVQAHAGVAKIKSYGDIAKGGTVRDETKTVTIAISHVEYETESRHYAHIDCPGHADYIKNMITGAAQMDGAILIVDGSQGPQFQTKEHILLARQVGVERVIVFINKVDIADAELLELVVSEANEALELHGYRGSPVVLGSALKALRDPTGKGACIRELLAVMQTHFPDPVRTSTRPSWCPSRVSTPSSVVAPWSPAASSGVCSRSTQPSRSSGSWTPTRSRARSWSRASRCSTKTRRRAVPART